MPGVSAGGVGWCENEQVADGGQHPWCIGVIVDVCAQTLGELTARLAAIAMPAGVAVGYRVQLAGSVGPRCEADDPQCVPQPYHLGTYDPSLKLRGLFESLRDGAPACRFDGECVPSGGHVPTCHDWTQPPRAELLILMTSPTIDHMLCGCVEGHCQWFVQ